MKYFYDRKRNESVPGIYDLSQKNQSAYSCKDCYIKNGYLVQLYINSVTSFVKLNTNVNHTFIHTNFHMVVTSIFKRTEKVEKEKKNPSSAHLLRLT